MKKVVSWVLILAAFVPLVMSHTLVPAISGKVLVYRGAAFLAILGLFLLSLRTNTRQDLAMRFNTIRRSPIFIAMTVSFGLLAVSTIFAFDRFAAFFGELSRGEGFLTLAAMYAIYVATTVLFQRKEWKKFFVATILCGVIIFIYQVWQRAHGIDRPYATLGNPIFLAEYYVFVFLSGYLAVAWSSIHERAMRWLGFIGMITSILGIFITETRGTIAGLGVAVFVCSIIAIALGKGIIIRNISARKIGAIVLGIMVGFVVLIALTRNQPIWNKVPGVDRIVSEDTTTLDSRVIYLKITKNGFIESDPVRKVVGWGWDNFLFFSNRNYDPAVYELDSTGISRAHNKLADMLVMTGILGLLAYLAVWVAAVRDVGKLLRKNFALGLGFVFVFMAYFVHNLFAFDVPVTFFYFYTFLAFLTQYDYEAKK